MPLNKRFKQRWLKALRSGNYEQAKETLVELGPVGPVAYCCLGVACSLSAKRHITYDEGGLDPDYWDGMVLPDSVMYAYGFESDVGKFYPKDLPPEVQQRVKKALLDSPDNTYVNGTSLAGYDSLASLNDAGVPFTLIADVIEAVF